MANYLGIFTTLVPGVGGGGGQGRGRGQEVPLDGQAAQAGPAQRRKTDGTDHERVPGDGRYRAFYGRKGWFTLGRLTL